jgi:hypothetical protein
MTVTACHVADKITQLQHLQSPDVPFCPLKVDALYNAEVFVFLAYECTNARVSIV